MVEQVEATQDDINAAQRICGLPADPAHIQADKVVQAFRDHRIAAEARGKVENERLREALRSAENALANNSPHLCKSVLSAALNGGQHETD